MVPWVVDLSAGENCWGQENRGTMNQTSRRENGYSEKSVSILR